ncbi:YcaO-like family protein [Oryzifoliimicrobium ureilyticus]|uniref:YcaO-like family protein n=1 Tax=Oryzifoliimicrobium ureilyticus TaxID=3113724 RepID=UPI0030763EE2
MTAARSDARGDRLTYSDRVCPPDETLRRVEPLLAQYGITRVCRLTGLDRIGVPVWSAVTPNAYSIVTHHGKGITDADARISATMEALERAIAAEPAITSVRETQAYLSSVGDAIDRLDNLIAHGAQDIAEDETLEWVQGCEILGGGTMWVPRDAVVLDRRSDTPRFWQSSDGLASGNTFAEASFHGLLERIERDAETLWNVSTLKQRFDSCCDATSFDNHVIDDLVRRIEAAGLTHRLFDITSDLGVPCFAAFIGPAGIETKTCVRLTEVAKGNGAHPVAVRAVIRAMTEAIQSRLTYISGARDDIDPDTFTRSLPREIQRLFEAHPQGRLSERQASFKPVSEPLEQMFSDLLDRLRQRNIGPVIAVSLTPVNVPIAVVKVIVPSLENPAGNRRRRFGARAIMQSLAAS